MINSVVSKVINELKSCVLVAFALLKFSKVCHVVRVFKAPEVCDSVLNNVFNVSQVGIFWKNLRKSTKLRNKWRIKLRWNQGLS